MATIDLKLKTYEQLQFEVMNLITKNYLQQQELDKYKNRIDKAIEKLKYYSGGEAEYYVLFEDIINILQGDEENE